MLDDLGVNLLASVISGLGVWVGGRVGRRRKSRRRAAFFGIVKGCGCVIVVPFHPASGSQLAVHQTDVAALIEVSSIVKERGGQVNLLTDGMPRGLGGEPEFCIAGPEANSRTRAHLETFLPGLTMDPYSGSPARLTIRVGGFEFHRTADRLEYVVVAKVQNPGASPVFIICGQTPVANHAGAIFLGSHTDRLLRKYGTSGSFCLVLRIINSRVFGPGKADLEDDFSEAAFSAPPENVSSQRNT